MPSSLEIFRVMLSSWFFTCSSSSSWTTSVGKTTATVNGIASSDEYTGAAIEDTPGMTPPEVKAYPLVATSARTRWISSSVYALGFRRERSASSVAAHKGPCCRAHTSMPGGPFAAFGHVLVGTGAAGKAGAVSPRQQSPAEPSRTQPNSWPFQKLRGRVPAGRRG